MAFSSTSSGIPDSMEGTMKVKYFDVTFAAVTAGYVKTGFSNIIFASHLNNVTENDGRLKINFATDGSTVEPGGLYLMGFTASDTARVRVVGY